MSGGIRALDQAWRGTVRQPLLSLLTLTTLTLGIAAATAAFSVIDAFTLAALPLPEEERLVRVREADGPAGEVRGFNNLSAATLRLWQEHANVFEDLAAATGGTMNLAGAGEPQLVNASLVTHAFFDVLGAQPALGREFLPGEDEPGGPGLVLLSHALWVERFGAGRNVIGKTLTLDGEPHEIIGVMPQGLHHPYEADLWVPYVAGEAAYESGSNFLYALGRLRPDLTIDAARDELGRTAGRLARLYPDLTRAQDAQMISLREELLGGLRPVLWVLGAGAVIVLIVAGLNTISLVLARSLREARSAAVRHALGARFRDFVVAALARHSLLLIAGTALALLVVPLVVEPLVAMTGLASIEELDLRPGLRATTVLVAFASASLLLLVLALIEARAAASDATRRELTAQPRDVALPRRLSRSLKGLLALQLASSAVVLSAAWLVGEAYQQLLDMERGFEPRDVLMFDLTLPEARYPDNASRRRFLEQVVERVRELPGIVAAGTSTVTPDSSGTWGAVFTVDGVTAPEPPGFFVTSHRIVSGDYFTALGIPLLEGRLLRPDDGRDERHAVVVSRSFAEEFWPQGGAIGRQVKRGLPSTDRPWLTVVGVVGDVVDAELAEEWDPRLAWYLPPGEALESAGAREFTGSTIVMRTSAALAGQVDALRQAIWSVDPALAIAGHARFADRLRDAYGRERFSSWFYSAFAATALAITLAGVTGVVSFLVGTRVREFGIRLALGAAPQQLLRESVLSLATLALTAVLASLPLTWMLLTALRAYFVGVEQVDLGALAWPAALLVLAALLAALPALRRVLRLDPASALRAD